MSEILIKLGVGGTRLDQSHQRLWDIPKAWENVFPAENLIITSTWEATHKTSGYHYKRRAWDIRRPKNTTTDHIKALQDQLGPDFYVLDEKTHIHIHYAGKEPP